jgi:Arc/MetJ-type ribon-helix-helix transcriptional regulator
VPPTETETVAMTIEVPLRLAESIRARVERGEFPTENDLVVHDLYEAEEWSMLPDEPFGRSLEDVLAEVPAQLERIARGEEKTFTLEEVQQRFAGRRAEFLRG